MSAVTPAAALAAPAWKLPSRARVGMLCLILTESAFFSIFVAAYVFYIGKSLTGPYPRDVLTPPILNTVCLLSSSITIVLALRALRAGSSLGFRLWWMVTVLLGLEFLIGTGWEWYDLIYHHGLTIHTNLFGTTFYSLVGLHAFHVTVGLIALSIVMVLALRRPIGSAHEERLEVLSWYWHFVDCVWIVVFLTVYVIGR
jgi:cytochrome c oxidase subunit 3